MSSSKSAWETCPHEQFQTESRIGRIVEDVGDSRAVTAFTADIRITCAICGCPFEFIGVPNGLSPKKITASLGNEELWAPIQPSQMALEMGQERHGEMRKEVEEMNKRIQG